jgi:hypothetical protein
MGLEKALDPVDVRRPIGCFFRCAQEKKVSRSTIEECATTIHVCEFGEFQLKVVRVTGHRSWTVIVTRSVS